VEKLRRGGCLISIILAGAVAVPASARAVESVGADTWNGKKIYLSPALHTPDNGGCDNFSENSNARETALATAAELRNRGYAVRVGTGDFVANVDDSNAWGADAHLPIHSNGGKENCYSPFDPINGGTLVMFHPNRADSQALASQIESSMDGKSPGTNDRTCPDWCSQFPSLHEVRAPNAVPAYVEVAYHTYRPDVDWMRGEDRPARAIARGVDRFFNYPRGCGQPPCPESVLARISDDILDIVEDNPGTVPGLPGDPGSLDPVVEAILDLIDQVDPGPVVQLVNQLLDTLIGTVDPAELIELVTNIVETLIGTVDPGALIELVNQLIATLLDLVDPAALVQLVNQLVDTVIGIVDPEALIDLVDRLLEAVIGLVDIEQLIDLVSALLDTLIGLVDIEQLIDLVSALLDTLIGLVDIEQLIDLVSALLDTLIGIVDLNQLIDTVCRVLQTVIQCGGLPPVAVSLALPGASGPASPV
jgi:N-acetylmuramoyl-L-alanine amidase